MGLFTAIVLVLLGLLGASSAIVKSKPNAQELIDKLVPIQGWLGLFAAFWGIWIIISAILNMGWISSWPLWWATYLGTGILEFTLGFLLGFSLISKYVLSKNEAAMAKGEALREKLSGYQIKLGYISIIFGIWTLVYSFMYTA